MNKKRITPIVGGLAAITTLVLVLTSGSNLISIENQALAQTISPDTTPFPSREKTISVTGIATESAKPDLLIVTFGVEAEKETASKALDENTRQMNAIVSAIRALGIDDDELNTSQLSIYPVYKSYRDDNDVYQQELTGYSVSNILTVKTAKLDSATDIIDAAVKAGANRVDGVHFTLAPNTLTQIKDSLLAQAVSNAKAKAENALTPLDYEIIGVKSVVLSEAGGPAPVYRASEYYPVAESVSVNKVGGPPVFGAAKDISTTAKVVFLIGSSNS